MKPMLHERDERSVPYLYIDNAMDSPDPAYMFKVGVRMLRFLIEQVEGGKNTKDAEKQVESALEGISAFT